MSLLRHIELCNDFRADRFLPFWHGADRLGLIRRNNAETLRRFPKLFALKDDEMRFLAEGNFDELSKIIDDVTEQLVNDGVVSKWRHECFAVAPRWGAAAHFKIDRGAKSSAQRTRAADAAWVSDRVCNASMWLCRGCYMRTVDLAL